MARLVLFTAVVLACLTISAADYLTIPELEASVMFMNADMYRKDPTPPVLLPGWTQIATFDYAPSDIVSHGHAETFKSKDTDDIVFVVRGTEVSIGDWIQNFKAKADPLPAEFKASGKAHDGMLKKAMEFWKTKNSFGGITGKTLPEDIKSWCEGNRRVIITGHSQGAGVAPAIAFLAKVANPSCNLHCWHFGGPMVFDKVAAANFDKLRMPTKRYFAVCPQTWGWRSPTTDPVTLLPGNNPVLRFIMGGVEWAHVGVPVQLTGWTNSLAVNCHAPDGYFEDRQKQLKSKNGYFLRACPAPFDGLAIRGIDISPTFRPLRKFADNRTAKSIEAADFAHRINCKSGDKDLTAGKKWNKLSTTA